MSAKNVTGVTSELSGQSRGRGEGGRGGGDTRDPLRSHRGSGDIIGESSDVIPGIWGGHPRSAPPPPHRAPQAPKPPRGPQTPPVGTQNQHPGTQNHIGGPNPTWGGPNTPEEVQTHLGGPKPTWGGPKYTWGGHPNPPGVEPKLSTPPGLKSPREVPKSEPLNSLRDPGSTGATGGGGGSGTP